MSRLSELRQNRVLFLLDLTWGGVVYRLGTDEIDETIDGELRHYSDGLDFGDSWEDSLDLFTVSPSERAISITLSLAGLVDVPARIADGHVLAAATARLAIYVEDSGVSQTLLDGDVRQVEYGATDEPVTMTIEERPLLAPGLLPDPLQRLLAPAEFDNLSPRVLGQFYPIIFGYPGGEGGWGSPALQHDAWLGGTGSMVVAGNECTPGTVLVVNGSDDSTQSRTVNIERDNNQASVLRTAIDVTDPTLTATSDAPYYLRWTRGNAGGVPSRRDPSTPMRGAGEIMRWLLDRSGARVDQGRMAILEQQLDAYRLDAALVPGPTRISPLEWVERQLVPILPISARVSSDGLYYVLWKWGATATDVVAKLNADEHQMSRVGAVEYSDRDDLYQQITLDYEFDYRHNAHQSSLLYTGDRTLANSDVDAQLDPFLEYGFNLHARGHRSQVRSLQRRTNVVVEEATSHLVLQYLSRRYGLQSRLVRYEVDPELAWLEPGHVVEITDEDLALVERIALVEGVALSSNRSVGLALRLLSNPAQR